MRLLRHGKRRPDCAFPRIHMPAAESVAYHAAAFRNLTLLPTCKLCQRHKQFKMPPVMKFSYADAAKGKTDRYRSDFPSLSGGPQPANSAGQSSWNSNILRQPPTQQQQNQHQQPIQQRAPQQQAQPHAPQPPQQQVQSQQQQRVPSAALSQQSPEQHESQRAQQASADQSSGGGEDFPPLGVQTNGDAFGQANGLGSANLRSPDGSQTQGSGQQTQLPFREASNSIAHPQQAPIGQPLTQTTSNQVSSLTSLISTITNSPCSNLLTPSWQPRHSRQHPRAVSSATPT